MFASRRFPSTVHGFCSNTASNRPNLMYRKAKTVGKTVEQLKTSKVPVPGFKGEPVFGVFPVLEALSARKRRFHKLYMKDSLRERENVDQRVASILKMADNSQLVVNRLTQGQLDRITEYQLHNGICLDASPLPFSDLSTCSTALYLDGVLDPQNIGAIARSAIFFGVGQIAYCQDKGPAKLTPSMSKSSCGALEHLPVVRTDIESCLAAHPNCILIGTSDAASAKRFNKEVVDMSQLKEQLRTRDVILVLGDEGKGVSNELMSKCDHLVTIGGSSSTTYVTSLNVSVVAGILLHQLFTLRMKGNDDMSKYR